MPYVLAAIVLVVLGFAVWWFLKDRSPGAGEPATKSERSDFTRLLKQETDFHVHGSTARVTFDVPASAGDDDMMRDLMLKQGYEALRRKRTQGLPIENIESLEVYGMRDGSARLVATMPIDEAPPPLPEEHRDEHDAPAIVHHDPLAALTAIEPSAPPAISTGPGRDDLPPLGVDLRLPSSIDSAIRAKGVDPATAPASVLCGALLEHAGYLLSPQAKAGTFLATGRGGTSYVSFVDHAPGSYPELAESAIDQFMYGFISARADRGFLFSDKFGPYAVYAKEKREPRIRFITRERMQAFVDSIAMG
ncbi:MAG TPA: hypothetical protein VGC47_13320 [Acidimicrobiia bacterium]